MNIISKLALTVALCLSSASFAVAKDVASKPAANATAAAAAMAKGEVKKIARDTGMVTIKHGELKNLEMPPMTMDFRVKDPAMLGKIKVGDKIRFVPDKVEGEFTVVKLEVVKS